MCKKENGEDLKPWTYRVRNMCMSMRCLMPPAKFVMVIMKQPVTRHAHRELEIPLGAFNNFCFE